MTSVSVVQQAVTSTILGSLVPWLNVFVALMPAEGQFEKVWWISMLQGVLLTAVYMCMLARELPLENSPAEAPDKQETTGGGHSAHTIFGELAEAHPSWKHDEAGEAC